MAYKFQKGTANLSGSIKLDSGYDLLAAGSNDLGTSAANFAVGYVSVLSASTVVSGAFFEGNASRMTGIAATDVTTTGTSTNSDFYPLFVDTAAGESGETVRVHSTVAINPGTGKLSATSVSASTGTGSFGGGISAGNAGFTVGYTGAVTSTAAITAGTSFIIGSADLNEADMEQIDGITAGTASASKAVVLDAGKDCVGFGTLAAGVLAAQGSITAGTSFIIGSADLNEADMEKLDGITNGTATASKAVVLDASKDIAGLNDVSAAGLTLSDLTDNRLPLVGASGLLQDNAALLYNDTRASLNGYLALYVSSSASGSAYLCDGLLSINDESDDEICTIYAGSADFAVDLSVDGTVSGSGALSVGAGATLAGALNLQAGGITNAGSIAGATTISGSGALSVGAGATLAGALSLNAGVDFGGQKTLTASVNLDVAGGSGIYHVHSHYIVSGSSAVVVDLPSLENGDSMWFKRHPSMTNNVTIRPSGSTNLIDGINDPVVLETAGASMQLVGSGSLNWYIY